MGNDFEVIIHDEERKKNFIEVFNTNTVKVKSPIPQWIKKPNGEMIQAYFLDLDLISKEERKRLVKNLSQRFNQPIEFVEENIDKIGVPILKEHCGLIIHNPQRWID